MRKVLDYNVIGMGERGYTRGDRRYASLQSSSAGHRTMTKPQTHEGGWRVWLWDQSATAAGQAYQGYMRDIYNLHYLFYRRGGLCAAPDRPEGWTLGETEHIPRSLDQPQLTQWIWERARQLPCLPKE